MIRLLPRLAPGLLLIGCGPPAPALTDYNCSWTETQTERPDSAQIQALLDAAVADGLPGVSLVIRHKSGAVWAGSSGYADLELQAPMQPCTPMRVGAISQMMASTALLTLVQDGAIGLDDPLSAVLTEGPATRVPNYDTVTIRQLLNHTSGVPDYALSSCSLSQLNDADEPLSSDAILRCVAGKPASFAPGEGWELSNTNYVLIGQVLDTLSGQSPSALLAERVFTPMGLDGTTLSEDGATPLGTARGYSDLSGQGDVYDLSDAEVGYGLVDAGVVSDGGDLTLFAETLLIREFLSDDLLKEMKTEVSIDGDGKNYGLGLIVERKSEWGKAFGHQGIMLGNLGEVWYLPDAKTSVALLVNGSLGALQSRAEQLSKEELAPLLLATAAATGAGD